MSCVLCGTVNKLECRNSSNLAKFIEKKYLCGPFAYEKIMNLKTEHCVICLLCLNHIRKRKSNKQKQMLPLDHYMIGLINPEFQSNLDNRSKKRIINALNEKNNVYATSAIVPLQLLIKSKAPVIDWWNLNLNTMFFKGSKTSRCVRINTIHKTNLQ